MAGSRNRITLKDIAKRLNLSMPTVSRALADHPDISSGTKERVREVAQALNYIPNYRARYLRAKHSRLIALVVPEMNMFFVPSMIAGINRVVQQNDYSLIVFQSDNSIVQERRLIEYYAPLGRRRPARALVRDDGPVTPEYPARLRHPLRVARQDHRDDQALHHYH
ncbi:MAG: LacI family DNA-binding transcriptional regulator [Gemmatimonadaceae bacterium]